MTFASAGHPPPLRLGADGEVGYVDVDPGFRSASRRRSASAGRRASALPGVHAVKAAPGHRPCCSSPTGSSRTGTCRSPPGLDQLADAFAGRRPDQRRRGVPSVAHGMGRDARTTTTPPSWPCASPTSPTRRVPAWGCRSPRTRSRSPASSCSRTRTRRQPPGGRRGRLTEAGLADLVDTAALLVSEIVTNALRHGGGPEELVVEIDADGVSIGVRDLSQQPPREEPGGGPERVRVVDSGLAENGRGLAARRHAGRQLGLAPGAGRQAGVVQARTGCSEPERANSAAPHGRGVWTTCGQGRR